MEFIPETRRESILYQELMDTQVELSKKSRINWNQFKKKEEVEDE